MIGITDTTEERGVSTKESRAYEARVGNNPLVLFKSPISEDDAQRVKEEDPGEMNKIELTHGLSNTRLYEIFRGMISRCENPMSHTVNCVNFRRLLSRASMIAWLVAR